MSEPLKYVCRHMREAEAVPTLEIHVRSFPPSRADMNEHITVCAICAGEVALTLQHITLYLGRGEE